MAKDLRSELRTKEALNASVAFSIVILVLFSFAFDPSSDQVQEFSGGLLWLVFTFAGALLLNRSFARETQNDCLDGLLAAPLSRLGAVPGQSAGEFRAADGGRAGFAARLRALLQRAIGRASSGPLHGRCCCSAPGR